MYQCLKIHKVCKELSNRTFYLVTFLDFVAAKTFTVYVSGDVTPPYDVGSSYELHFKPTFDGLNFLADEK